MHIQIILNFELQLSISPQWI